MRQKARASSCSRRSTRVPCLGPILLLFCELSALSNLEFRMVCSCIKQIMARGSTNIEQFELYEINEIMNTSAGMHASTSVR